jgi:uncharacterized membrane protein
MEKRFRFLLFFSGFLKVLAWLVVVSAVIAALVLAVAGGLSSTRMGQYGPLGGIVGGAFMGFVAIIVGLIYFLFLYAASEMIKVFLAIEENTRRTAPPAAPAATTRGTTS